MLSDTSFNNAIWGFLLASWVAALLLDAVFLFKNLPIEICEIRQRTLERKGFVSTNRIDL